MRNGENQALQIAGSTWQTLHFSCGQQVQKSNGDETGDYLSKRKRCQADEELPFTWECEHASGIGLGCSFP